MVVRKVGNDYPAGTSLVLYLNIWPVAGETAYRRGVADAVAPALAAFKEVWVLDDVRSALAEEITVQMPGQDA